MIGKVNAAIASMQDQHRNAETIADMPIPQKAEPLRWRPASLPSGTGNFLHRMLDAFPDKYAVSQAEIIVTVIASVAGGAMTAARTYVEADHSRHFPFLPLGELQSFLLRRSETDEMTLVKSFRSWVREQIARGWPTTP